MKIFPARGWHLWYVNPPSSLSSSCAFSSLFTPIALSTVATAPISSNLPRRQKLTFMSVLNLLPSEEKRGKLFWSFWLKGILSQIYDHCSEVFLRLESKICTVQSSQIDKKNYPKSWNFTTLHTGDHMGWQGVVPSKHCTEVWIKIACTLILWSASAGLFVRVPLMCTYTQYSMSTRYHVQVYSKNIFKASKNEKTFWMYSNLENFKSKK